MKDFNHKLQIGPRREETGLHGVSDQVRHKSVCTFKNKVNSVIVLILYDKKCTNG